MAASCVPLEQHLGLETHLAHHARSVLLPCFLDRQLVFLAQLVNHPTIHLVPVSRVRKLVILWIRLLDYANRALQEHTAH